FSSLYVYVYKYLFFTCVFFFSSRRRHTRSKRDWSSDVCSSDLYWPQVGASHRDNCADIPLQHFAPVIPTIDPPKRMACVHNVSCSVQPRSQITLSKSLATR